MTDPAANPAAQRQALRVQVYQAGMQRISGAALAQLGASRIGFDPAQLQLHRDGQEVALQLSGAEDGRLAAGDELRFSAPDPGDRWKTTDTYWLTVADQPSRRSECRDSSSGTVPQRATGHGAGFCSRIPATPRHSPARTAIIGSSMTCAAA